MAFILDIRRGNLLEHLLYKALFELSDDMATKLNIQFYADPREALLKAKSCGVEATNLHAFDFASYRSLSQQLK